MTKLNEEQILEIAARYENKRDFRENEPEAYRRAVALGCLKKMKLNDERGKWGLSKLRTIAKQYGTRGEFREHDRLAYNAASRLGHLDKICAKMDGKPEHVAYDTIYIARTDKPDHYKVGITAARRGFKRLKEQGLAENLVIYAPIRRYAFHLEQRILTLGESSFEHREIRRYSADALAHALYLITKEILRQPGTSEKIKIGPLAYNILQKTMEEVSDQSKIDGSR